MKVLTWNILAAEWVKKSYYPGVDTSVIFDNKARFARIGKILKEIDADIIMLQEVMPQEYLNLVLLFGKKYFISELKTMVWGYNKNSESGNVTFLKRSLFPKNTISHYPLEYGVYTQCIYKNRPCDIFNIHLDDQSPQKRYKQWDNLHAISRKKIVVLLLVETLIMSTRKNVSCIIRLDLKRTTCVRPIILSAK